MIEYIFVLFVLIYFVILWWKRRLITNSLPPGPPAFPIVGNLLQIDRDDQRKTFVEWHKKYGPMFTVWLGMQPTVFVTGVDLMQELFVKRGDEFVDRPRTFLLFDIFGKGGYGVVNISGQRWHEQRRFSLHVLRDFGFCKKLMEESVQSQIYNLIASLQKELKGALSESLNMKPHLDVCISNIISTVVLGKTFAEDDPAFLRIKHGMEKAFYVSGTHKAWLLDCFPWLRHVPLFNHFGYNEIVDEVDHFYQAVFDELQERKQQVKTGEERNDFASAYCSEMERRRLSGEDMGYFSEFQLVSILVDIWSAAIETTATTLRWAILLMMHYPDVQRKVQAEIDDVVGLERYPSMSDRLSMPFTVAVMHEVQRYANVISMNLARTVKVDTKILDYTIPKGVAIIPQISVVHFDDKHFDRPFEFRPDRFLDECSKLNKNVDKLMPFSLGRRICMGESLARMELFLVFSSLLQQFSFTFVKDEPEPSLKPKVGFEVMPYAYNVCITKKT